MAGAEGRTMQETTVDTGNLYREELFSDLRVASVRRLTPVKADGTADGSRVPLFIGQAHVMSAAGPLPIQFSIEAATLDEALGKFPAGVKLAVEKMIAEVKELKREEASRIIVPGEEPGGTIKLR
jgi:hypothetical protein